MDKAIVYCKFCPHCAEGVPREGRFAASDEHKQVWYRLHIQSRRHRWWWWLKRF